MDIKSYAFGFAMGKKRGDGSGGDNGKVREISTAAEMDTILANATANDVGRGFLYLGETTDTYKFECVYIIREG